MVERTSLHLRAEDKKEADGTGGGARNVEREVKIEKSAGRMEGMEVGEKQGGRRDRKDLKDMSLACGLKEARETSCAIIMKGYTKINSYRNEGKNCCL